MRFLLVKCFIIFCSDDGLFFICFNFLPLKGFWGWMTEMCRCRMLTTPQVFSRTDVCVPESRRWTSASFLCFELGLQAAARLPAESRRSRCRGGIREAFRAPPFSCHLNTDLFCDLSVNRKKVKLYCSKNTDTAGNFIIHKNTSITCWLQLQINTKSK